MGSAQAMRNTTVPLESVIATAELARRPARHPEHEAVTAALIVLAQTMANAPERILQKLAETALDLCHAHSSGISLLEEENGKKIFRWHAVAGQYSSRLWETTPREFSPCGAVLDTGRVQLMSRLGRHFSYFDEVEPRIAEALLVPFHLDGIPVGAIWVISHDDQSRRFDAEDARVMNTLGEFTAAAYKALSGTIALKSIVATIREPLLVLDGALRIKSASRSFYETFQVTPEQTEGRFLGDLGNGQWNIPELPKRLQEVLTQEAVIDNLEVAHDFPVLGQRVMSLNARRLWSEGNPASLILLAIEDITSRKHIEEELLRSNEDAQHFAAIAAHDLRAPLNSSVALLQLLKDRSETRLDNEGRRVLSLAMSGLVRLQGLMGDILSYAKAGETQNREPVSLQEPLEIALANLQRDIQATQTKVDLGTLPTVKADRTHLTLVFQNLIGNAIKFRSDEPPRVQIRAVRQDGECVVSIADNGQGFDPRYAEHIFLPFKRLSGPEVPGSGFGLASCKRIVERLGGRIWAEGAPGKGATFHFTLPYIDTGR